MRLNIHHMTTVTFDHATAKKITDRIKTFLDACEALNISIDWFEEQTQFDSPDEKAYKKMKIIARALNEG